MSKMFPVLVLLMAALVVADKPLMDLSSSVHCDATTVCPEGSTCCLSPYGVWYCCPFSMGQCCRDGVHCCRHGYHCDSTSTQCLRGWLRVPSSPQPTSKAMQKTQVLEQQTETEIVHCEGNVYCPAEKFCCKTAADQWGCCSGMVL